VNESQTENIDRENRTLIHAPRAAARNDYVKNPRQFYYPSFINLLKKHRENNLISESTDYPFFFWLLLIVAENN
jgi:hypothetical protein